VKLCLLVNIIADFTGYGDLASLNVEWDNGNGCLRVSLRKSKILWANQKPAA